MSQYIVLERISVQNANCIAGLTYGFPAITHFLGYTHALSRKLQQRFGVTLSGCAVICHHHQVHAYQQGGLGDAVFALTKNPLKADGSTPAFVEEGRMHMTVSLVMRSPDLLDAVPTEQLRECINEFVFRQKLAGGNVVDIKSMRLITEADSGSTRRALRRLLPGFALVDRSSLLTEHYQTLRETKPDTTMLNAWLDFASLTYRSNVITEPDQEQGEGVCDSPPAAEQILDAAVPSVWSHVPKPAAGYLVPITTGYRAVSALYAPGEVAKSRDGSCPFRFVEPCYGVGQWLSPHRISDLDDLVWQYEQQGPWYLCKTPQTTINKAGFSPEQEELLKVEQISPLFAK